MAWKRLRLERGRQQTQYISRQLRRENNAAAAAAAAAAVGGDSIAPRPWLKQYPHYTMPVNMHLLRMKAVDSPQRCAATTVNLLAFSTRWHGGKGSSYNKT